MSDHPGTGSAARRDPDNTSRRRLLTLLGATGVAAAAVQVPRRDAAAADGDTMIVGGFNQESTRTMLEGEVAGDPVLWLQNWSEADHSDGINAITWGNGFAIQGHAENGVGVWGRSGSADGLQGWSETGNGVNGSSGSGVAGNFSSVNGRALQVDGETFFRRDTDNFAVGISNSDTGSGANALYARSHGSRATLEGVNVEPAQGAGVGLRGGSEAADGSKGSGVGVVGESGSGIGVVGSSESGVGIQGASETGAAVLGHGQLGIGGHFSTDSGIALQVDGPAAFSTAGSATIPQGATSVFVTATGVTANSHISVTFVGDPGTRTLRWVERTAGSGFRVHLSQAPSKQRDEVPFTYLIVEPTPA